MIKSILPYDISRGGQTIQPLDLSIFQNKQQGSLNKYLEARAFELETDYNRLVDLYQWNNYVMQFKINFEPIVGRVYYLYEGTTKFISILTPTEFTICKCIGSTKLTADNYWIKQ